MNSVARTNITLTIVFLAIIWVPIQTVYFGVDAAGRIPTILVLFAVFINIETIKLFCYKKPIVYYLLLALYMLINGFVHNSHLLYGDGFMGAFVMFGTIFRAPLIMLLIISLCRENYKKTLTILSLAIVLYGIICALNGQMVESSEGGERLTGITNANEMALVLAIGFSIVLMQYIRKDIHLLVAFIIAAFLVFVIVFATGSRMGFGMMAITAIVSILFLRKRKNVSSTIVTVVLLIGAYFLINYLLENTFLGARMMETTTQIESSAFTSGTILDKFGDRGIQYYQSWPVFLEHPIFGIGFHQWVKYNPLGLVCHSEYLVQYLEGGVCGFALYLLFFCELIKRLWKSRNALNEKDAKTVRVLLATMCAIVFCNSVLWTYNSNGVFAIYGLSYGIIIKKTHGIRKYLKMDKKELYRRKKGK